MLKVKLKRCEETVAPSQGLFILIYPALNVLFVTRVTRSCIFTLGGLLDGAAAGDICFVIYWKCSEQSQTPSPTHLYLICDI